MNPDKNIPYEQNTFTSPGDRAAIQYSSEGRFSLPGLLYFGEYGSDHITSLTLAGEEAVFKTIVDVLDDLKYGDEVGSEESVANMTIEELTETLVHVYVAYDEDLASKHEHAWVCECQENLPDNLKKTNKTTIDLNKLIFRTISEADDDFKSITKDQIEPLTDKEFKEYLELKYQGNTSIKTKEEEIESVSIKDNVTLIDKKTGDRYTFMYPRFGHVIKALDFANQKWRWKIQKAENKKAKDEEIHLRNLEEVRKLKELKAKDILRYLRSLQLVSIKGERIETDEKKIKLEEENKIPANIKESLIAYQNYINFGINSEQEFKCPHCGESDRRLLRQEINIFELLPIHRDSFESDTQTKPRQNNRILTFFGQ